MSFSCKDWIAPMWHDPNTIGIQSYTCYGTSISNIQKGNFYFFSGRNAITDSGEKETVFSTLSFFPDNLPIAYV